MTRESKIGHLLTVRFGRNRETYPIIGEFVGRFGDVWYYVPVWREELGQFLSFKANSYSIERMSDLPMTLSDKHQAMARSIRYARISQLCERLRRHYGIVDYSIRKQAIGQDTAFGTRFTLQDEYELVVVDENETMKAIAKSERDYYEGLRHEALVFSGIL